MFILNNASQSTVVASHRLTLHQYADDCQLYLSVPVADVNQQLIYSLNASPISWTG